MRDYGINTGLRLPRPQFDKLNHMAKTMNVSRNKMVALLIDKAEIESSPILSVDLQENKRQVVPALEAECDSEIP